MASFFGFDGTQEIVMDEWTTQRTWQKPGPWRGYTFMEIKRLDRADHGRSAGERGASTAGDVETSDDDYDLVYSDTESRCTSQRRP